MPREGDYPDKEYYSVADLAERFGVSQHTVRRWLRRDDVKPYHFSKRTLRYHRDDITIFESECSPTETPSQDED